MSGETHFLNGISRLRTLLRIRAIRRILLTGSAIFLSIFTVASGSEKIMVYPATRFNFFYPIAAGIALVLSVLYACARKKSFLNRLIEIDTRLKLQDRISTAYEYHRLGIRSDWGDLLLADAGRCLGLLDKEKIVPKRFSFVHLFLAVLILINIAVAFMEPASHASKRDRIDPKTLERMHTMLKRHSTAQTMAIKPAGSEKIEKEMESLSKMLQEPSAGRSSMRRFLQRMLKEVRNEKTLLSKTLTAKLEEEGIEELPGLKMRSMEALSFYRLKRLAALLDRLFENQVPETIAKDVAALFEHHRIEQLMEQLTDELDRSGLSAAGSGPEASDTAGQRDGASVPPRHAGQNQADGSTQSTPGVPEGRVQGRETEDSPAEEDGGRGSDEGFSSSPGLGKSEDHPTTPYALEKSKRPAVQDRTLSDQKQDYSVHIRSLTAIGKAKEKSGDVTRPYRQELEAVLQKEEIPENYKIYIKNYFLSIGLGKEAERP